MLKKLQKQFLQIQLLIKILHTKKIYSSNVVSNRILVLFTPFIGDTILYLNVLRKLCEYYQSKNMLCSIITLPQNKSIIEKYCKYNEVITIDFEKYIEDTTYRVEFNNKITCREYQKVINPYFDTLFDADFISYIVTAKEKIVANRNKWYSDKFLLVRKLKNSLRKKAYSNFICVSEPMMDFMKQSIFMRSIGISDFKAAISYLEPKEKDSLAMKKPYCIVAPGASKRGKRWEEEKYAKVITYIIENYSQEIYICGSKNENYIFNKIIDNIDKKNRSHVHNNMGKTSLLDYIEFIRTATFVVTNDSAAVHIASSVGTPSVCVIGGWDYLRLLPYQIEFNDKRTIMPVPVYSDKMECSNCFDKYVGYRNKMCKRCIKQGRPYPCISSIQEKEVIEKVDKILAMGEADKK